MNIKNISEALRSMDTRHYEDGDGGYALLSEILRYTDTLGSDEKHLLRDELLRLVEAEDRTMWGVALESLVQGWKSEVSTELAALMSNGRHTDEWNRCILFALVRLGYSPIAKKGADYISHQLAANNDTVLPMLAALCKVDRDNCLELSVKFFIESQKQGQLDELKGYIPAFVNHFLDTDPNLLVLLIRNISKISPEVSSMLAQLLCEYCERPYMVKRLGSTADELKAKINSAMTS